MLLKTRMKQIVSSQWILIASLALAAIMLLGGYVPGILEAFMLDKCYNCDPPEIVGIAETSHEATLWTPNQGTGGFSQQVVDMSYFAGLVESYQVGDPASGTASTFNQSVADTATISDWYFLVALATTYQAGQDFGLSLRKVDEPANPSKGDEKACPLDVPDIRGAHIEIDPEVKTEIMTRFERCQNLYDKNWRKCHYQEQPGEQPPEEPLIKMVKYYVPSGSEYILYDVCAEVSDLEIPYTLRMGAEYQEDTLSLDFKIGMPGSATWATLLILTTPTVQVIPLWIVTIPVLDPTEQIPVDLPMSGSGWIGIWSGLFPTAGAAIMQFQWVNTT